MYGPATFICVLSEGGPLGGRQPVSAGALPWRGRGREQRRPSHPLLSREAAVPGRDARQSRVIPLLHRLKWLSCCIFKNFFLIVFCIYCTVYKSLGLLHQFRILPEKEGKLPSSEQYIPGLTCQPRPFKVILQPRQWNWVLKSYTMLWRNSALFRVRSV